MKESCIMTHAILNSLACSQIFFGGVVCLGFWEGGGGAGNIMFLLKFCE